MKVIVGNRQTGKTHELIEKAKELDRSIILVKDINNAKNLSDLIRKEYNINVFTSDDLKFIEKGNCVPTNYILIMTFWEAISHTPIRYTYPIFIEDIASFTNFLLSRLGGSALYATLQLDECEFTNNLLK